MAMAAFAIGISPVMALPEPVPELFERAACLGAKKAGSHCEAGNVGKLACSNDHSAAVISSDCYDGGFVEYIF